MKTQCDLLFLFVSALLLSNYCVNAYKVSYCISRIIFPINGHKCFKEKNKYTTYVLVEFDDEDKNEEDFAERRKNENVLIVLVKKLKDYEKENTYTGNKRENEEPYDFVILNDVKRNKYYLNKERDDELVSMKLIRNRYIKATFNVIGKDEYRFLQKDNKKNHYDIYYESFSNEDGNYLIATLNEKTLPSSSTIYKSNDIELYNPNKEINY